MTIFRDAHHYNNNSSVQAVEANYLIKKLNLDLDHKTLLDIGCGDGKISAFLHHQGAKVTGIDASKEMISFAQQHFPECQFRHLAAEHLAEIDHDFDVMTSFNCLHWVHGLDEALAAAKSRLKTNGVFFGLIYPKCHELWDAAAWVENLPAYQQMDLPDFSNPYHFYTRESFNQRLTAAGFTRTELWQESKQAGFDDQVKFKRYISGWLPHCGHYPESFIDDWFARYAELTGQPQSGGVIMKYDIIFFVAS